MASVHDVAAYILARVGPVTTMKLQKLVYYAQAWSMAWDNKPLFGSPIQAWRDGPVSPELFWKHKGDKHITAWPHGNAAVLVPDQRATIDGVVAFYGRMPAEKLIELTHREQPWRIARGELPPSAPGNAVISIAALGAYYGATAKAAGGKKEITAELARGIELLLSLPENEIDSMDEDVGIDAETALQWLETGEGDPWAPSG